MTNKTDKFESPWVIVLAALAAAIAMAISLAVPALMQNNSQAYAEAIARVGGDPQQGVALMKRYGCAACHIIPGLPNRGAVVGPNLKGFASKPTIGETVPNTPDNLIRWIVYPTEMDHTATMPSVGATETHARHMATYLYALK